MRAGEKFHFDYSNKRGIAGISSIENADVNLRMSSVLTDLAEECFLVCSCLFQFCGFSKNKHDLFFYSLVLRFKTMFAAIRVIL